MLVHDAQRGPGGDRRTATVATHPPLECFGVPALGALLGGPPAALPGRLLELRAGSAGPAPLYSKLASQEPGFEGGKRPASPAQVVGGVLEGPDADAGLGATALTGGQPCPQHREAGKCRPAGAPPVAELTHRHTGLLQSEAGLPVQDGDLRQQHPRLGQDDVPALLLEFHHGLLGGLHGLGQQAHRKQQLTPVG